MVLSAWMQAPVLLCIYHHFLFCFPSLTILSVTHPFILVQIKNSLSSLPTQAGMQHTAAKVLKNLNKKRKKRKRKKRKGKATQYDCSCPPCFTGSSCSAVCLCLSAVVSIGGSRCLCDGELHNASPFSLSDWS